MSLSNCRIIDFVDLLQSYEFERRKAYYIDATDQYSINVK